MTTDVQGMVNEKLPRVREALKRHTDRGCPIGDLVGIICDGKGQVSRAGERADVIPWEVAQQMTAHFPPELPELGQIAEFFRARRPGLFPVLVMLDKFIGLVTYRNVDTEAPAPAKMLLN